MSDPWLDPPTKLTPEQRRDELAAILALGVLPVLCEQIIESPAKILEFSAARLEVPAQMKLC